MILSILAVENQMMVDVVVKPEQRIKEVVKVLATNFKISPDLAEGNLKVYSGRHKAYLSEMLTFKQAKLCHGDVLEIGKENER